MLLQIKYNQGEHYYTGYELIALYIVGHKMNQALSDQ